MNISRPSHIFLFRVPHQHVYSDIFNVIVLLQKNQLNQLATLVMNVFQCETGTYYILMKYKFVLSYPNFGTS